MTETALRAPAPPDARLREGTVPSRHAASRRRFRIQIQTSLDSLPPAWSRLEATGHYTAFQTQAWLLPWYRVVGAKHDARPLLVTVSDAETHEPLLFFPLVTRRDDTYRWIEFADLGVSDYNAPLVAAGFQPEERQLHRIMREIFAELPSADLLRFDKTPDMLGGVPNPLAGHEMFHRMRFQSWGVDLPPTRQGYESLVSPCFSKELARKHRRLAGKGEVALQIARTEREVSEIFGALVEQRHQRFSELGRPNILDDEAFRDFYETVILSSLRTGFACLAALRCGDDIVATLFGLRSRGIFHLLMSTMQGGKWKSSSPGNVIIDEMISAMIADGEDRFDFTIGDESYKRDFGASSSKLYECVRAQSILGAPFAFKTNARSIIRNRLRGLR
jgi:CelD/BcsL family acetyltransferase involved in cellulose biosynthesis